jgi:hypothetical protein
MTALIVFILTFFLLVVGFAGINFYHLYKHQELGTLAIPSIYLFVLILILTASFLVIKVLEYYFA